VKKKAPPDSEEKRERGSRSRLSQEIPPSEISGQAAGEEGAAGRHLERGNFIHLIENMEGEKAEYDLTGGSANWGKKGKNRQPEKVGKRFFADLCERLHGESVRKGMIAKVQRSGHLVCPGRGINSDQAQQKRRKWDALEEMVGKSRLKERKGRPSLKGQLLACRIYKNGKHPPKPPPKKKGGPLSSTGERCHGATWFREGHSATARSRERRGKAG